MEGAGIMRTVKVSRASFVISRRARPASTTRRASATRRTTRFTTPRAADDSDVEPVPYKFQDEDEELSEADKLRAKERFMVMDLGKAECTGCGYVYDRNKGDPEYPVSAGVTFSQLPQDWTCPICGAEKKLFDNQTKTIAGFAENQKYGLGTNTMTGDQKLLLIYGSLLVFFGLFLAGYAFD
mmetsp:Transcript_894/g.3338  ORF Transcript_894/g.3338 Transcript_894/m.3338 type:complete len:182 (-) Transcript_894:1319-1864(-)